MRLIAAFAVGVLALVGASGAAQAAQIEYDFAGIGTGTVNGVAFNGNFDFRLIGDDTAVTQQGSVYRNSITSGVFYSSALPAALSGNIYVQASTPSGDIPYVTFFSGPTSARSVVEYSNTFAGYNLATNFGQTATDNYGVRLPIATAAAGNIRFSDISEINFSASHPTVLGTPGPVAGAGLVPLLGLAGAYLFRRKRLAA